MVYQPELIVAVEILWGNNPCSSGSIFNTTGSRLLFNIATIH